MTDGNRPPTGFATTRDGVRLAYWLSSPVVEAGSGRRKLVLVHSLALDASVWAGVAATLAGDVDVLTYDCRGHGQSDRAPGPYDIDMFGEDLADLLDHVGWDRALVGGCSMGGCVVQAFAAAHPGRVEGLLLVDTTDWYGPEAPATWRARAAVAQRDGLAGMAAFQTTRWFGDDFREAYPETVRAAMQVFCANDLGCYAATCIMLGDADLRGRLANAGFPVAIVVGEEDYATPVAAAEGLAARIPGASVTVLKGARHLTPIECPGAIVSIVGTLANRSNSEVAALQ